MRTEIHGIPSMKTKIKIENRKLSCLPAGNVQNLESDICMRNTGTQASTLAHSEETSRCTRVVCICARFHGVFV